MGAHSIQIKNTVDIGEYITNEIPSGAINNFNKIFTAANVPVAGTEQVHLNGVLQKPGVGEDYTLSGNTITFDIAPKINNTILVSYVYNS